MSEHKIKIGSRTIGEGSPIFIIAEIGINHNGDLTIAEELIDAAVAAGADAVKFQKRTPELCVPDDQKAVLRETPWGTMTYLDYRRRTEFDLEQYQHLGRYAAERNVEIFASPWDALSLEFLSSLGHPAFKVASASLTDLELLRSMSKLNKPIIASTGMSTLKQIDEATAIFKNNELILCHTTSSYPCSVDELNLKMICTLKEKYKVPIGYSGHEVGLGTSLAAIALGAVVLERHITLNRSMWGSDQAASVEPLGFAKLVRDVRAVEKALGDGIKKVYESERKPMQRLRLH